MSKYNGSDFYDGREFYDLIKQGQIEEEKRIAKFNIDTQIEAATRMLEIESKRLDLQAKKAKEKYRDKLEAEFEFLKSHSNNKEDYKIAKQIVDDYRNQRCK